MIVVIVIMNLTVFISLQLTFKRIDLSVCSTKIVCIFFKQTSLLMSLLNELIVHRGSVKINGRIAYSAQQPWIFPGTVRQNILFGRPFKKEFYEKVIMACALAPVSLNENIC